MVSEKKIKILFVEQSKIYEKTLRHILPPDSFEIATEKDVDVALLKVVRWHPDFLITGIEIGNISGFDLCLILKMMPDFAGLRIILISSNDAKITHIKAADAGADYYVVKDHDVVENIKIIIDNVLSPSDDAPPEEIRKRLVQKVLVVDDSTTMRKIIKNILYGLGIKEVTEAGNGQEGLKALETEKFDMVISDWAMPVMNGLDMVKKLRENPVHDGLPVVMVSAEAEDALNEALHEGVDAYLRKPFNALKMQELIDKFSSVNQPVNKADIVS